MTHCRQLKSLALLGNLMPTWQLDIQNARFPFNSR